MMVSRAANSPLNTFICRRYSSWGAAITVGAATAACGSSSSSLSCSAAAAGAAIIAAATTTATAAATTAAAAECVPARARGENSLRASFYTLVQEKILPKNRTAPIKKLAILPSRVYHYLSPARPTVSGKTEGETGGFCRVSGFAGRGSRGPAPERASRPPDRGIPASY